jgi:GNAT superfamily N-acetyltransferase
MNITIREATTNDIEGLIPLLLLAEPSEGALRWSLGRLSDTVYRMDTDGLPVGAATVRWHKEPNEIVELAIAPDRQGQGLGRRLVQWLVEEARRRDRQALLVGTGNASTGNIIFYQKCGFRMDHVRQDYFWYYDEPPLNHGIPLRDMLVFRYDLVAGAPGAAPVTTRARK